MKIEQLSSGIFEYLVPLATALAAIVALALGWALPGEQTWLLRVIAALLVASVLSQVVERFMRLRRMEGEIRDGFRQIGEEVRALTRTPGVERFFTSRREAPGFREYTQSATREIFAAGPTLVYLATHIPGFLQEKALQGCKVRLLLQDLYVDGERNPVVQALADARSTVSEWDELKLSLERFSALTRETAQRGGQIEIRVHRSVPTLGLRIVDGAMPEGKLMVELSPYRFDPDSRPCFELTRSGQPDLFGLFYEKYSQFWETSRPWSPQE